MNSNRLYLAAFFVVVLIISWSYIMTCREPPWPPRLVGAGIVFGMLDLTTGIVGDAAPIMAVGFVLAFLVNHMFRKIDCQAHLALGTAQPPVYQATTIGQQSTYGTTQT